MSVNIPPCLPESPDFLVFPVDPRRILNDPERYKSPGYKIRNSHVREWLINNERRVKIAIVLKKEASYERSKYSSLLEYNDQGQPKMRYRYEIPAPINGETPADVIKAVREFFKIDNLEVAPTPKQLALAWMIVFKKPRTKIPWVTSKAAGVANQPGKLPLGPLAIPVNVVDDEVRNELDGYLAVNHATMEALANKFNIADNNGEIIVPTAVKLSGIWPHCSKFVVGCDPNMPEPCPPFTYWSGNDKGEPRATGLASLNLGDFRLVQHSEQYYKIGCGLSYQALSLADNWADIAKEHVLPALDILGGVVKGKPEAIIKAMEIDKLFEVIPGDAYDEDGKRREFYQQAEFLLASGATPKNHPKVQQAMWKTAHFFANRISRGIFVPQGHMAYALPSAKCGIGEVIMSKRAWRLLGKPKNITVVRYPINQRSEIRQYKVRWTFRKNAASDHAAFVNPLDWHEFHNGDFDGDLIFMYDLNIQISAEVKVELSKGSGRASKSAYEEAYKTCMAGTSVGIICNMLTLMRCVKQCFGYPTEPYQRMLAEGYHTAIQATKNCDFDHRSMLRTCRTFLDQVQLDAYMPWLKATKPEINPETLERKILPMDAANWNIKQQKLAGIDKRWNKCLLGWVHGRIARIGEFKDTNLIQFDRGMFTRWAATEDGRLMTHSEDTDTAVSALYVSQTLALDATQTLGIKLDFNDVRAKAAELRKLEPSEREAAAIMIGHKVGDPRSTCTDWLFSLVAPLDLANKVYGGKKVNNLQGIIRHVVQAELIAEAEQEQAILDASSPSISLAELPSIQEPKS